MRIRIEESGTVRRASACIRVAGEIHVKVPRHWPAEVKHRIAGELAEKLKRKDEREKRLLENPAVRAQPRITLTTREELEAFVRLINAETFQLTLGKVAIGKARYHHLAQLNLRTKTMTVSAYCLSNVPLAALRYLVIHELAHHFESGHGPRFWRHVARHVPDYRVQSRIIKAFHHQAVIGECSFSQ
jgi:predicted metal-dependent hydrolase